MYGEFTGDSVSKKSTCNAEDLGLVPGSGRIPGEGNGNPFQYSCLEKSHGRKTVHKIAVVGHNLTTKPPPSVVFSSVAQSCPILCDPMNHNMPGLPVHHQLPEFTQTHVHWVSDAIQPSHPLSSPSSPALNLSQHQDLFKWVSIRWPKYWTFSFSLSPSNEHPGLFFRMDWLDLLAV